MTHVKLFLFISAVLSTSLVLRLSFRQPSGNSVHAPKKACFCNARISGAIVTGSRIEGKSEDSLEANVNKGVEERVLEIKCFEKKK